MTSAGAGRWPFIAVKAIAAQIIEAEPGRRWHRDMVVESSREEAFVAAYPSRAAESTSVES
jgi:hypothetical protein